MYLAAIFLPLIGSLISGILSLRVWKIGLSEHSEARNRSDKISQVITCVFMALSAIFAISVFIELLAEKQSASVHLFTWLKSGSLEFSWVLRGDMLSVLMVTMVTVVATMIHIYSIGYMSHDSSVPRFMSYLSLFTFFMLMLVTSDNLVQMFFGWEGVGLASYLLIGFWYDRPSANAAAIKAFVVNRVGDFGFILGIFGVFLLFDSVNFDTIFNMAESKKSAEILLFSGNFHDLYEMCFYYYY